MQRKEVVKSKSGSGSVGWTTRIYGEWKRKTWQWHALKVKGETTSWEEQRKREGCFCFGAILFFLLQSVAKVAMQVSECFYFPSDTSSTFNTVRVMPFFFVMFFFWSTFLCHFFYQNVIIMFVCHIFGQMFFFKLLYNGPRYMPNMNRKRVVIGPKIPIDFLWHQNENFHCYKKKWKFSRYDVVLKKRKLHFPFLKKTWIFDQKKT